MNIYKRPIKAKLTSLRVLFLVYFLLGILVLLEKWENAGYVLALAFLFSNLFVVNDFRYSIGSFTVVKHYFFGLIPFSWKFEKGDRIEMKSAGGSFDDEPDLPISYEDPYGLGALYGCLYPVIAKPKTGAVKYTILETGASGKPVKQVSLFITKEEYDLAMLVAAPGKVSL